MAISRMQQPQQMQGGLGSLDAPRQGYFLGKLVKKATRGIKKVFKSPLGKMALIGGGMYGLNRFGLGSGNFGKGFIGNFMEGKGKMGALSNILRSKNKAGNYEGQGFDMGKLALGGLGAAAVALPFMGGGGDDEDDGPIDQMDPSAVAQRARNFYSGQGAAGVGLDFMPQKKYVNQNFYTQNAADGGRIGYANGGYLDEEEEFIRSGAGQSRKMPTAFLAMGGGAGEAQAEQMLQAEFIKYKNKGGELSFQQFVQAVMQQEQQSQGMQQPTMMAADGGRIGYNDGGPTFGFSPNDLLLLEKFKYDPGEVSTYKDGGKELISSLKTVGFADGGMAGMSVPGYGTPAGTNQFGYPSGGERVNAAEGGIMETEEASEMIDMGGNEKDFRETGGFVEMGGEERADDVPARLSKNEFVFTADAVRNAGGGDIDRGSEVMQNLMDNLEQGGQVSEDSQGLGGGEEMMSEEIIEEPGGAQAMYEQQQALQSRMA